MQDIKLLFVVIISYAVEARILHSREPYFTEVETKWQPSFIQSFEIHYIYKNFDILIIGIHCFEIFFLTLNTVYEYGLTLIPAFTSNDTHY